MTQRAGDLAGLVEFRDLLLQSKSLLEREHRTLAPGDDDRIESCHVDVGGLASVLDQRRQRRGCDEPHADQIACRVAARITRIAQGIGLTFPAIWAEYLDGIALVVKTQIRVRKLTPPEADRPAGR